MQSWITDSTATTKPRTTGGGLWAADKHSLSGIGGPAMGTSASGGSLLGGRRAARTPLDAVTLCESYFLNLNLSVIEVSQLEFSIRIGSRVKVLEACIFLVSWP